MSVLNEEQIQEQVDLVMADLFSQDKKKERNITMYTGEAGMELFNEWMQEKFPIDPYQVVMGKILGQFRRICTPNLDGITCATEAEFAAQVQFEKELQLVYGVPSNMLGR